MGGRGVPKRNSRTIRYLQGRNVCFPRKEKFIRLFRAPETRFSTTSIFTNNKDKPFESFRQKIATLNLIKLLFPSILI